MAAGRAMGWVALLDEKKTRRTRDFTLLVGSSFFVSRAQPTPPGDRFAIAASSAQLPALCAQAGGGMTREVEAVVAAVRDVAMSEAVTLISG